MALIAGTLVFLAILRAWSTAVPAESKAPTVYIVVAARSLGVPELIEPDSVELLRAPAAQQEPPAEAGPAEAKS